MAVLNKITGSTKMWRWGPTEQRAFERTKALVQEYREKTRKPLSYAKDTPKIWLVTDASMTGAAGHVCQGDDWKTAKPVAFWSGKFSSAEQAYRTHEQELLAIIELLKRFRHHLLGIKFTIVTDHERLESFMTQKDVSIPPGRREVKDALNLPDPDVTPKRGRGRPRKSVPENTNKPVGILPVEEVSAAPPSNATVWPSSAIHPAKSAKRPLSKSDKGESEMEEAKENIPKYVSKKQEYQ
jgi:RNase H-like domain found in reverse transcriptase